MSAQSDKLPRRHRLTVEEYRKMAEVGLLARDLRVELINGEIIDMAPIESRHAALVSEIAGMLRDAAKSEACVSIQSPLVLGAASEPQPDVMLLQYRADKYCRSHPTAREVLLLVEVSDTTLRYDSGRKLALYAAHRIPEVWILDIEGKTLHVFTSPQGDKYCSAEVISKPTAMRLNPPSSEIDTSELFRLLSL